MKLIIDISRLDEIKAENGIGSDHELARTLGMSAPMISQIRTGVRGVGALFITKMLTELNVPFNFDEGSIYQLKEEE